MSSHRHRHTTRTRGLTLIEVLVVLGIIAILIGILVPIISNATAAAKGIVCVNNLRQMAIAALAYASQNDDSYPIAYGYSFDGTTSVTYCWDLTTVDKPGQLTTVVPGLLWQLSDPARIQQCPSFEGRANWLSDPYTGYNYNTSYIGHGQDEAVPAPATTSAVSHPATTVLFGDGQWAGGANKFMRAPFPSPGDSTFSGRWAGTQGFRHRGRTNVAFCDGHAEALSDRWIDNADGSADVASGTGFLSSDNQAYGGP